MMDNLNVHHNPIVLQMIAQAGHMHAFRAPHWPKDGPIECFFNTLEQGSKSQSFDVDNAGEMEMKMLGIFASHQNFINYFENVGFH